jgi:hypothetical protein
VSVGKLGRRARAGKRPGRSDAILAWLVTGPLGHLWSAVADMVLLWARYLMARSRGRA